MGRTVELAGDEVLAALPMEELVDPAEVPKRCGEQEAYQEVADYFESDAIERYAVPGAYAVDGEWRSLDVWRKSGDSDQAVIFVHGLGAGKESWYEQFIDEEFGDRLGQDQPDLVAYDRPMMEARHYSREDVWRINREALESVIEDLTRDGKRKILLVGHSFGGIVVDQTAEYLAAQPARLAELDVDISLLVANTPTANMSTEKNVAEDSFLNAGPGAAVGLKRLAQFMESSGLRMMESGYDRLPKGIEWIAERVVQSVVLKPFLRESGMLERRLGPVENHTALLASLHNARRASSKPREMIRVLKDAMALTKVPRARFDHDFPMHVVFSPDDAVVVRNMSKYPKQLQRGRTARQHPIVSEEIPEGHCSHMVYPERFRPVMENSLDALRPLSRKEAGVLAEGCVVQFQSAPPRRGLKRAA